MNLVSSAASYISSSLLQVQTLVAFPLLSTKSSSPPPKAIRRCRRSRSFHLLSRRRWFGSMKVQIFVFLCYFRNLIWTLKLQIDVFLSRYFRTPIFVFHSRYFRILIRTLKLQIRPFVSLLVLCFSVILKLQIRPKLLCYFRLHLLCYFRVYANYKLLLLLCYFCVCMLFSNITFLTSSSCIMFLYYSGITFFGWCGHKQACWHWKEGMACRSCRQACFFCIIYFCLFLCSFC